MRWCLWSCLVALSCSGEVEPDPPQNAPDLVCPGDASGICDETTDSVLKAGAARLSVVPECFETYDDVDGNDEYQPSKGDTFADCGCDRLCPEDAGYPGPDSGEGDGEFQAIWIAGFQSRRAARGVRGAERGLIGETDGLWVTAAVVEQGQSTLAIVSVDGFGWMNDQVDAIRERLEEDNIEIDHLVLHSTHSHATPDTLGIYGSGLTSSGLDPAYASEMRSKVVSAIREAKSGLTEVALRVGRMDTSAHPEKGITNFISDTRDPWVIDPWLGVAQLVDVATNETVATLVNWANHPEASADSESLLSADLVHGIRSAVEHGVSWDSYSREGVGGLVVYLNGTVGGMMTPLRIENEDPDGVLRKSHSFEKTDAIGLMVGELALDALAGAEDVPSPRLAFRNQRLFLPIVNQGFQAMYLTGVLDRAAYNYNEDEPLTENNVPEIRSEISFVELGPVQMLTFPGEVLPELAIGGYDGSQIHAPGVSIVGEDNPNPPDLEAAPEGPYWKDLLSGDHRWIVGLANDEVGYIIPQYNFIVHDAGPYILEAEGDHYEETNSLGPQTAQLLGECAEGLVSWTPTP